MAQQAGNGIHLYPRHYARSLYNFPITQNSRYSYPLLVRGAESLELDPGFLEIIVDDDFVKDTGLLGKLKLVLCLSQTLSDGVFGIRLAATKALLEDVDGWRL